MIILYVNTDVASAGGDGSEFDPCKTLLEAASLLPTTLGDDYTILLSGSSDDVGGRVSLSGIDVSSFSVLIKAADGYEAVKTGWDNSRYSFVYDEYAFNNSALDIGIGNVTVDGLQIKYSTRYTNTSAAIRVSGHNTAVIQNCYLQVGTEASATCAGVRIGTGNGASRVYNCISVGFNNGFWSESRSLTTYSHRMNHCVANSCEVGFQLSDTGALYVTNSAALGCTDDFLNTSTGTLIVDHCASDDGDGTNAVSPAGSDWGNEFADVSTGDFTLLRYGNLYSGGTAISGGYAYDIDGDQWDETSPSIGSDEYIAPPPKIYPRVLFGP